MRESFTRGKADVGRSGVALLHSSLCAASSRREADCAYGPMAAFSSKHEREAFSCGREPLDRYFRQQVGQDVRKRVTACYVTREIATDAIRSRWENRGGRPKIVDAAPVQ